MANTPRLIAWRIVDVWQTGNPIARRVFVCGAMDACMGSLRNVLSFDNPYGDSSIILDVERWSVVDTWRYILDESEPSLTV